MTPWMIEIYVFNLLIFWVNENPLEKPIKFSINEENKANKKLKKESTKSELQERKDVKSREWKSIEFKCALKKKGRENDQHKICNVTTSRHIKK